MQSLIRLVIAAGVAVACSYLAACGGGSTPFADFSDELNEPVPASATTGSTLAECLPTN